MFTREHLIQYLADNVTDLVLQNALNNGTVESYGWFDPLPYIGTPGFIVSITSCRKKTYIIGIGLKEITGDPFWFRIESYEDVPWSAWKGGSGKLHQGDNPEEYRRRVPTNTNFETGEKYRPNCGKSHLGVCPALAQMIFENSIRDGCERIEAKMWRISKEKE